MPGASPTAPKTHFHQYAEYQQAFSKLIFNIDFLLRPRCFFGIEFHFNNYNLDKTN
jgi:hypothetical protein